MANPPRATDIAPLPMIELPITVKEVARREDVALEALACRLSVLEYTRAKTRARLACVNKPGIWYVNYVDALEAEVARLDP